MAVVSAGPAAQAVAKTRRHPIVKSLRYNYDLYLLLLPALAYLIIFKYAPMYGLQISFRDFNPVQGMWGSPWAGLKHFFRFFDSYMFVTVVRNTLALNLYQLLVGFPIPIMLALLLNQVPNQRFKQTVQTSIYAPHFISMVVMVGMLHLFLSPRCGLVNHAIGLLGAEPVYFFGKAGYFRSLEPAVPRGAPHVCRGALLQSPEAAQSHRLGLAGRVQGTAAHLEGDGRNGAAPAARFRLLLHAATARRRDAIRRSRLPGKRVVLAGMATVRHAAHAAARFAPTPFA